MVGFFPFRAGSLELSRLMNRFYEAAPLVVQIEYRNLESQNLGLNGKTDLIRVIVIN